MRLRETHSKRKKRTIKERREKGRVALPHVLPHIQFSTINKKKIIEKLVKK